MNHHRFPWQTVGLLGLTTYLLIVVLSLWWQAIGDGWRVTMSFSRYFPGEPWVDAVVLHAGGVFILCRWWGLLRSLWDRYGP